MSTRLDVLLQKHPEHEEPIRALAARDPSGSQKYLGWGVKMLVARQALAPEIADVIDLFHQFAGRWINDGVRARARVQIRPDIYSYRPQDMASLRDNLLKMKRAQDRKRRKREKLYKIEGSVDVDVVYDSSDLIVRHIKNKNASVHYGLGTKWCISMMQAGHFEEYESHNATFFFFERKVPVGDEYDKVALAVPRTMEGARGWHATTVDAFTSLDERVDMMQLARVHGSRVFDIFRDVYERSERYPGSVVFQVNQGKASAEQLLATFDTIKSGKIDPYEMESLLESVCCNDAAASTLLEDIYHHASALVLAAWRKFDRRSRAGGLRRRRRMRRRKGGRRNSTTQLMGTLSAAIAIHPNTPDELRQTIVKALKRKRIAVGSIRTTMRSGNISVVYGNGIRGAVRIRHGHYRRRLRRMPLNVLRRHLVHFENAIKRTKKRIKKAEKLKKLSEAKRAKKLALAAKNGPVKVRHKS